MPMPRRLARTLALQRVGTSGSLVRTVSNGHAGRVSLLLSAFGGSTNTSIS